MYLLCIYNLKYYVLSRSFVFTFIFAPNTICLLWVVLALSFFYLFKVMYVYVFIINIHINFVWMLSFRLFFSLLFLYFHGF